MKPIKYFIFLLLIVSACKHKTPPCPTYTVEGTLYFGNNMHHLKGVEVQLGNQEHYSPFTNTYKLLTTMSDSNGHYSFTFDCHNVFTEYYLAPVIPTYDFYCKDLLYFGQSGKIHINGRQSVTKDFILSTQSKFVMIMKDDPKINFDTTYYWLQADFIDQVTGKDAVIEKYLKFYDHSDGIKAIFDIKRNIVGTLQAGSKRQLDSLRADYKHAPNRVFYSSGLPFVDTVYVYY